MRTQDVSACVIRPGMQVERKQGQCLQTQHAVNTGEWLSNICQSCASNVFLIKTKKNDKSPLWLQGLYARVGKYIVIRIPVCFLKHCK